MVETYKCPSCGAPIEFSGQAGEMVCQYCQSQVDVATMEKINSATTEQVINEIQDEPEYCDFDGYKCDSCGAEIVTDEYTTATFCSFCGSPAMIKGRLSGTLKPQKVIPFSITKEQAIEAYKKWAGTGLITPSGFKTQSTIEKLTGIYVPFWLYDYSVDGYMRASGTKHRSDRRGDTIYKHTDYYDIGRHIQVDYERIPADASEKMDDHTMDLLEPYDYSKLTDFKMPYLSGYQSERYTYDADNMASRVETRVRNYTYEETKRTIMGYSNVHILPSSRLNIRRKRADYTLMPVWLLNYIYRGKKYTFIMNGQTGKVLGKAPKSKGKVAAWFGGILAGSFGILMLFGGLFG